MFENIPLRGAYYRGAWAKEYIAAIEPGEILFLERELENNYDAYAIKVLTRSGAHLAYVAKEAAVWIAPRMDDGEEFIAEIQEVVPSGRNLLPIATIRNPLPDESFEDFFAGEDDEG